MATMRPPATRSTEGPVSKCHRIRGSVRRATESTTERKTSCSACQAPEDQRRSRRVNHRKDRGKHRKEGVKGGVHARSGDRRSRLTTFKPSFCCGWPWVLMPEVQFQEDRRQAG